MKSVFSILRLFALWVGSFGVDFIVANSVGAASPPNVLVILADDLGFSDLGCYGSEIHTPNLDGLAAGGLKFTQFYNTARCWPTRAALLTGYYAQQVRRDTLPDVPRGIRPAWARLLPEMLSPLGYRNYHSGKWHLDGKPVQCGFDRSYQMADHGRYFNPQRHFLDDRPLPPIQPDTGFYTTTAIADHAINVLREHAEKYPERPFLEYLAFTAPHFPLHALPQDIANYQGVYQAGWDAIRQQRWERIQSLSLVEGTLSEVEPEVGPPYDFPDALKSLGPGETNRPMPWNELSPDQQTFQATKMTLHAAMIDRLDREIGRVLQQLRTMGVLDNTLIFFLSDNGASAEIMVRDDGHDPQASPGSAATYLCLGPGWSTTCNTPFRRHKTWTHEGGIHTPLIVHWPKGITARGQLRRDVGHVIDLVPTILAATGGKRFETWQGQPVPQPPGKNLLPVMTAEGVKGSVTRDSVWWSHEGNRALRVGDWKLVAAGSQGLWELYDLSTDPSETRNLAEQHPEKVRDFEQTWMQRQEEFRVVATADLKH